MWVLPPLFLFFVERVLIPVLFVFFSEEAVDWTCGSTMIAAMLKMNVFFGTISRSSVLLLLDRFLAVFLFLFPVKT